MKISNKVKRNVSLTLMIVGLLCTVARVWEVVESPASGMAWFRLAGILLLTYCCFDDYMSKRKLVNNGILFGSK